MLKKLSAILALTALTCAPLAAQAGGESIYRFLQLPASPHAAALAGAGLAPLGNNVGMVPQNPALLDSAMHLTLHAAYLASFADVAHSSLSGAWHAAGVGTFGVSFAGLSYGQLAELSEAGEELGQFSASELAVALHYARSVARFLSVGASITAISSQLERYSSYGAALSVGARYRSADGLFNATLSLKNAGLQLKPYREGNREPLPFEIQLCLAQKLERAPLGFAVTFNDLQTFDLYHSTGTATTSLNGEAQGESAALKVGKELLSHLSLGVMVAPSKYFCLMGGYSYRRSSELAVGESSGGAGFSFGFGLLLKYVELRYARATYQAGASSNQLSLLLNINQW
ncbi:MAG: type IX secretion system protein PorQ [Prevotellaceae bacterium]|jgi:hypothetical protein|nr:type IX secretion system protein PorQ [Prevotellaceae bacterium]